MTMYKADETRESKVCGTLSRGGVAVQGCLECPDEYLQHKLADWLTGYPMVASTLRKVAQNRWTITTGQWRLPALMQDLGEG